MTFSFPDDPIPHPEEFRAFVRLFNEGEYYEAHEVLEDLWSVEPGPARNFYKGLIMSAVAILHWKRGNANGARKLWRDARVYLNAYPPVYEELELGALRESMDGLFTGLASWKPGEPCPPLAVEKVPRLSLGD